MSVESHGEGASMSSLAEALAAELPALGGAPPSSLEDARLQLHWAAQLLAAFGQNFADARDDDSHRSMDWSPDGADAGAASRYLLSPRGHHPTSRSPQPSRPARW